MINQLSGADLFWNSDNSDTNKRCWKRWSNTSFLEAGPVFSQPIGCSLLTYSPNTSAVDQAVWDWQCSANDKNNKRWGRPSSVSDEQRRSWRTSHWSLGWLLLVAVYFVLYFLYLFKKYYFILLISVGRHTRSTSNNKKEQFQNFIKSKLHLNFIYLITFNASLNTN